MSCRRGAKVLWVFTGSGTRLRELAGVAASLSRLHMVTIVLTRAGFEVARVYGILGLLRVAAPGDYYRELIVEESWSGLPVANRVAAGKYDVVIVAPCTSNCLAKIAHGVADDIASTVVNQALKSGTPVVIVPSEAPGGTETELPCYIDESMCTGCMTCVAVCPVGAIEPREKPRIMLEYCVGCRLCQRYCPVSAVSCFKRVLVKPSPLDLKNLERILEEGLARVAFNHRELLRVIAELGLCTPGVSKS